MNNRQQAIADAVARRIEHNQRKRNNSMSEVSNVSQQVVALPKHAGRDPIAHDDPSLIGRKFGRSQAPNDSQGDKVTSCMSVGSQVGPINIVPVDRRTIEGSYPGDSRLNPGDVAKASTFTAAEGNGGPRSGMGQFKGSRNETQPPFIPTANAEETGG